MDEAELRRLLAEKTEGFRVEYKREISDPMKLAKSVAALANAQGGRIFIGVEERTNELPFITGVNHDKIHNKDRITNILADRIRPKVTNLEVEMVVLKKKGNVVFVVTVPPTSNVHGLKSDESGWKYYIRRPARVDELDPDELARLTSLKRDYKDNMKCRHALLSATTYTREEFARILEVTLSEFEAALNNKAKFRRVLMGANARNLSENFIEAFRTIDEEIRYALTIPHGKLSIEEKEHINEIRECVSDFLPSAAIASSFDPTSMERVPKLYYLSILEWVKYSVEDMESEHKDEVWETLWRKVRSHWLTVEEFIGYVREQRVPFTEYYVEQFCNHLGRALSVTERRLNALQQLLVSLQAEYGEFRE